MRIGEPAADLAVLMAVYSSIKNKPLEAKTIVFGEVGLAGEIRPVSGGRSSCAAPPAGFRRADSGTRLAKQAIGGIEILTAEASTGRCGCCLTQGCIKRRRAPFRV